MVEEAVPLAEAEAADDDQKAKRERSRVDFPYSDLEAAAELASTVQHKGGGSCDEAQLAAWLNQSVSGGTFRSRLSAARMFGLLEGPNKMLTLTDTGRRIADPKFAAEASVEAFLHLSLYRALYEKFNGYSLPPAAAIERQMVSAGVVATQSARARQAFIKSAAHAGFIDAQTGRFVKPGISSVSTRSEEQAKPPAQHEGGGGGRGGSGGGDDQKNLHPFILGLLKTLPEPESDWPISERTKWLKTAASIFGLIYRGEGSVKIESEGEKTTPSG
jgi:hypothetical protein